MEKLLIELAGNLYPYQLIRTNTKRLSVRYKNSQFHVRAPRGVTISAIELFFHQKTAAILQLVHRDQQQIQLSLTAGSRMIILGTTYLVVYGDHPKINDQTIVLRPKNLRKDFLNLLTALFSTYVEPHYQSFASVMLPRTPPILSYKWLTSRFGQYHTKQDRITLSLMLAFYEKDLIDYVIVHELAHAIVPAHNKDFYREIALALPDYRARQRRLRQLGGVTFE